MTQLVLMIHMGRCGSTVLGNMLNQHDSIYWDGELFRGKSASELPSKLQKGQIPYFRWYNSPFFPSDPYGFIQSRAERSQKDMFGFEIKFWHLRLNHLYIEVFIDRLRELGYRHFILLRRRNYLRAVVSNVIGMTRNFYHQGSDDKPFLTSVRLDPEATQVDKTCLPLLVRFAQWDEDYEQAEVLLSKYHAEFLEYEQHLANVIGDNLNCRLATVCLSTPKFLGKQSPRAQSEK